MPKTTKNDLKVEKAFAKALFGHVPNDSRGTISNPLARAASPAGCWQFKISENIVFECRYCASLVYYKINDPKKAAKDGRGHIETAEDPCPKRTT